MRTSEVTLLGGPEVLELRERPGPVAGPATCILDGISIRAGARF
jgi:hypothetical protein